MSTNEGLRPRPRKQPSADGSTVATPGHNQPTTFFLRSEREMQQTESREARDCTFGVQSLEDTLDAAFSPTPPRDAPAPAAVVGKSPTSPRDPPSPTAVAGKKRKAGNPVHPKIAAAAQRIISSDRPSSRASSVSSSAHRPPSKSPSRRHARTESSASFTPLHLSATPDSCLPSTPRSGSVRSLRLSDEEGSVVDDATSQALHSSSEDEDAMAHDTPVEHAPSGVPQLVMPSISMPPRRPFTEKGKRIGRLKILIAGPAGVGKTSLVRTIFQECEDIVHIDPLDNAVPPPKLRDHVASYPKTRHVSETNASTKAYPSWWSDIEQGRGLRRRKSMGESVLERNICFVDTPGWGKSGPSDDDNMHDAMDAVVEHIEDSLRRNAMLAELSDAHLLSVLSGGGGFQVDVILYMFHPTCHQISPAEADILRRLSSLTNIIPVIGKADTCTDDHLKDTKAAIKTGLEAAGVRTFAFETTGLDVSGKAQHATDALSPFAVSSALGDDTEIMDASLLMSSEYMQPLVPSDLSRLVERLFDPDNVQWLRHCAVKKSLQWRREYLGTSLELHKRELRELAIGRLGGSYGQVFDAVPSSAASSVLSSPSGVLIPRLSSPSRRDSSPAPFRLVAAGNLGTTSHYDFSRQVDLHKIDKACVQIPDWARDLKIALDAEQQVRSGLVLSPDQSSTARGSHGEDRFALVKRGHDRLTSRHGGTCGATGALDPNDPLGLLALGQRLNTRARTTLQVAGGCGAVATVLVWVFRNWGTVTEALGLGTAQAPVPGYTLVSARESRSPLDFLRAIFPGEKW